jgi:hypothetical protein
MKADKEERGVGMQGFQYSPDLLEFSHIVATHSPRAYHFIKDYLPLPTPRTIKYVDQNLAFWLLTHHSIDASKPIISVLLLGSMSVDLISFVIT